MPIAQIVAWRCKFSNVSTFRFWNMAHARQWMSCCFRWSETKGALFSGPLVRQTWWTKWTCLNPHAPTQFWVVHRVSTRATNLACDKIKTTIATVQLSKSAWGFGFGSAIVRDVKPKLHSTVRSPALFCRTRAFVAHVGTLLVVDEYSDDQSVWRQTAQVRPTDHRRRVAACGG